MAEEDFIALDKNVDIKVEDDTDNAALPWLVDDEVLEIANSLLTIFRSYDFSAAQIAQLRKIIFFDEEHKFPGKLITPYFSPSRIRSCINLVLGLTHDEVEVSTQYDLDYFINLYIDQVATDSRVDDETVELVGKFIYAIFTNDSGYRYENLDEIILFVKTLEDDCILEITRYVENGFILPSIEVLEDISLEDFHEMRLKMLNERRIALLNASNSEEEEEVIVTED